MAYPVTGPSSPQLIPASPLPSAPEPQYPAFSSEERSYAQYVQNFPLVTPPALSPLLFRKQENRSAEYQAPAKNPEQIFEPYTYANLKVLLSQCLGGFNPQVIDNHPIHAELFKLCGNILPHCQTMPLHQRISYLESFVSEAVIAGICAMQGKETQAELLEIGLRNHLSWGMIAQERAALAIFFEANEKFPLDLLQTETALCRFVTKNDLYHLPHQLDLPRYLLDDTTLNKIGQKVQQAKIALPLENAISQCEAIVVTLMTEFQLTGNASQSASSIESMIRHLFATRMIAALAGQFRNAFQTTGRIDPVEFEANIGTLKNFFKKFEPGFNIEMQLIKDTLELPTDQPNPFDQVRQKAESEKELKIEKKSKLASFASRLTSLVSRPSQPAPTLQEKKSETIARMEKRWKELTSPPSPSAPPEETPAPIPRKYKIEDKDIPVISYVSVVFEGKKFDELPPIVQRDILNHVFYHPEIKGKVEEATRDFFNNDGPAIFVELKRKNKGLKLPETGLQVEFVNAGLELLELYHSLDYINKKQHFMNKFQQLPKVPLFYQYVYEMARAANIEILDWDHHFGENNWEKILPLSVQALERCLHTIRQ